MKTEHVIAALASLFIITACGQQADEPAPEASETAAAVADAGSDMGLPASTASDEALAHYKAGWDAFDVVRFNAAHDHFEEAIAADPSFAMAHLMAAFSSPSTEGFASGIKSASEHAAGASRGEQLVIEAFQKGFDGDQQGQTAALTEAAEVHPDSPHVLQLLAFSQVNQNDIVGQRATLAKALELDSSLAATNMQLGNSYMFQEPKDFEKAEFHFMKAAELAPDEPNPHDLLGDVHRAQNKLEAAYDDYTKAAELAPDLGSPLQQRGHVNSFLGNFDEARADYTRSAELEDARGTNAGPGFLLYRTFVSLHEGNPDAAIAEMRELAASIDAASEGALDNKINLLTNAATVATHNGDADTATEIITEAAALMRQQAEAVGTDQFSSAQEANISYLEGMLAARMGDAEGAAAKAAEFEGHVATNTNPRRFERMHEILGHAAYYQEDYAAAVEHLSAGDVVNNDYTKYFLCLSHESAGNAEEANKMLNELAVWNFNSATYGMTRADILARAATE